MLVQGVAHDTASRPTFEVVGETPLAGGRTWYVVEATLGHERFQGAALSVAEEIGRAHV